jgi:hypothetical protein
MAWRERYITIVERKVKLNASKGTRIQVRWRGENIFWGYQAGKDHRDKVYKRN